MEFRYLLDFPKMKLGRCESSLVRRTALIVSCQRRSLMSQLSKSTYPRTKLFVCILHKSTIVLVNYSQDFIGMEPNNTLKDAPPQSEFSNCLKILLVRVMSQIQHLDLYCRFKTIS